MGDTNTSEPVAGGSAEQSTPYAASSVLNEEQETELSALLKQKIDDLITGADRTEMLSNIRKWRRQARLEPEQKEKTYPWQKASNIVTPVLAQKVNTTFAKLVAVFSTKKPFWDVSSDIDDMLPTANAITNYLNYLAEAPFHLNIDKITRKIFYDLPLIGVQFVKVPWLYDAWQVKDASGAIHTRVAHDGPAIVPIRFEDFIIPSYASDIQTAPFVGNIVWLTDAELKQRAAAGIYSDIENTESNPATELDVAWQEELSARGLSPSLDASNEIFNIHPIFEGYVFYDADNDGVPEDIKVWMDIRSGQILRSEDNTFGMRDIVKIGYFPVSDSVFDIGLGHMLSSLQDEGDFLHNLRSDNLHLTLLPIFKHLKGTSKINKKELHPLSIIDVDSMEALQQFPVLDTTNSTYNAENLVRDYADRISGASEPMSGYADPVMKSGADVGSLLFLAQQGNSIQNAIFKGIEDGFSDIGQLVFMQLVDNKERVDLSMLDPDDAALVNAALDIDINDLPQTFQFKVVSTEQTRTEDSKLAQLKEATSLFESYATGMMQLIPMIGNPQVPQNTQQFAMEMFAGATLLTKQILKAYHIEGVEEMVPNVGGSNGAQGNGGGNAGSAGGGNGVVAQPGAANSGNAVGAPGAGGGAAPVSQG